MYLKYKIYRIYAEIEGKGWIREGDNTNKGKAIKDACEYFAFRKGKATIHVIKATGEWRNYEEQEEVYTKKAEKAN